MTSAIGEATLLAHRSGTATDRGGLEPSAPGEGAGMDQTHLLLLAIAVVVALGAVAIIRDRIRHEEAGATSPDLPFAVSSEGMKICPKCGMGNLWTDRTCMTCKAALKG